MYVDSAVAYTCENGKVRRTGEQRVQTQRVACGSSNRRRQVNPIARTYFGTNVKMHQTPSESGAFVDALARFVPGPGLQLFVILPFTSLATTVPAAHRAGIWVGAQNVHGAAAGEYTGEISAPMLRDLDVDLALVGHAERRTLYAESDAVVRTKVESALRHGLRVLLCVGESAEERRYGASAETVVRQLKIALHGLDVRDRVMIAYEPVWAIGVAGTAAEPQAIAQTVTAIRSYARDLPLLYGGSVTEETAPAYAALPGVDGLFVGRAARSAGGYERTARAAYTASIGHSAEDAAPYQATRTTEDSR